MYVLINDNHILICILFIFIYYVFSKSMANAIRFYESKGNLMLKDSNETADFVEFLNDLFDNFNRNLSWQGLKLDNEEGFQVKK